MKQNEYNKYIFNSLVVEDRQYDFTIYAKTKDEAFRKLNGRNATLVQIDYVTDVYVYHVKVSHVEIEQSYDVVDFTRELDVFSETRLTHDQLKELVKQQVEVETDTKDYVETTISEVEFAYEVE